MSSQFSASLSIERRPSRRLAALYACLYGGGALGIGIADIPAAPKTACFALLAYAAAVVFRRHILLLSPDSIVAFRYAAEQWTIYSRDGSHRPAQPIAAAFWIFDIISFVFKDAEGKRFTVLLPPDAAGQEPLRGLRAWVRHRLPAA